jgi:hypothetical protein
VVPPAETDRARDLYQSLKDEQWFDPRSGMEGLS